MRPSGQNERVVFIRPIDYDMKNKNFKRRTNTVVLGTEEDLMREWDIQKPTC